jgi:hypothetical protein
MCLAERLEACPIMLGSKMSPDFPGRRGFFIGWRCCGSLQRVSGDQVVTATDAERASASY